MKLRGITRAVYDALVETVRVTGIIFARKSMNEKDLLIGLGFNPWEIQRTLRRFESNELLESVGTNLRITKKGKIRLQHYEAETISFNPEGDKWDGVWRIIIFDIPEQKRYLRDLLRKKLKEWKFKKIQHSVFVTPYDCKKELTQLLGILEISRYVYVIPTKTIGPLESVLKSHFRVD